MPSLALLERWAANAIYEINRPQRSILPAPPCAGRKYEGRIIKLEAPVRGIGKGFLQQPFTGFTELPGQSHRRSLY